MNQRFAKSALIAGLGFGLVGCAVAPDKQESVATLSAPLESTNGFNSANGLSGVNGLSGTNGFNSANGLSGVNGFNAANGLGTANGFSGMNGLSGANGLNSFNGLSGVNGLSGINGLSGVNGLSGINGLSGVNGLSSVNGWTSNNSLTSNGLGTHTFHDPLRLSRAGSWLSAAFRPENGLDVGAGLATDAGLANGQGLMTSEFGQKATSYLVRCALPAGTSITKYDADGSEHVFEGSIGLAPEWETDKCDANCQEWVSACMLAHVNLTGQHVSIWLTAEHPAVDWSLSDAFPAEEAAFFGNVFAAKPQAYACYGHDVTTNPIPGRVCVGQASCPYVDPYLAQAGFCSAGRACAAHRDESGERQGYARCQLGSSTWSHVMTTWKPAQ